MGVNDGRLCFYDVWADSIKKRAINDYERLLEAAARVRMVLDISARHKLPNFVICGGPMSLISEAYIIDNMPIVREMSDIFCNCDYQNVCVMSVSSDDDDHAIRDAYRQISSRHMSIMSDSGKHNSYRLLKYKDSDANRKFFINDLLALINN